MQAHTVSLCLMCVGLTAACQFYARGPEKYRAATRAVIETRSEQIQACYEDALKKQADAGGKVVVSFSVAPETGAFNDVKVLEESTAPKDLSACVVKALDGLVLDPPDQRQGDATFNWEFTKEGVDPSDPAAPSE